MKICIDISRGYYPLEKDILGLISYYRSLKRAADNEESSQTFTAMINELDHAIELIDYLDEIATQIRIKSNILMGFDVHRPLIYEEFIESGCIDVCDYLLKKFSTAVKRLRFSCRSFSFTCKNKMWNAYLEIGQQQLWDDERLFRFMEYKGISLKNGRVLLEKT